MDSLLLVVFFFVKPLEKSVVADSVRRLAASIEAEQTVVASESSSSDADCSGRQLIHQTESLQALGEYADDSGGDEDVNDDDHNGGECKQHQCNQQSVIPLSFHSPIVKLFTYPPPPAVGGVTVTNEDLFCLNDGEFLNDVIIEFYVKFLYHHKFSHEQRERTHIFNTFFYGQLTKEDKTTGDTGQTAAERRHVQVRRWTKHVDLFTKDFIIVPINEDSHWFLAIICFPYLVGSTCMSMICPTEDSPQSSLNKPNKQCVRRPCILIFDSLKSGVSRWSVAVILREYLQVEWNLKKASTNGPKSFDKSVMKGATPACPQQSNSSDCGVYVLQYIQSFFEDPLHDFTLPIRYLKTWFTDAEVVNKRRDIRRVIIEFVGTLNPGLKYIPGDDGCDGY